MVELYERIEELQSENLRVSEKLFEADKATKDIVYRAQAELSGTQQEKMHVENLQRQSRSYFNFILNRPLEEPIQSPQTEESLNPIVFDYDAAREYALQHREELNQIQSAIAASKNNAAIVRSNYFPGVTAVVDYGFQGEEYNFSEKDDYWMASLVLEWNLFKGFQDKARLEQVYLQNKKLSTQEEEIKRQIALEVERIYDNLKVAQKTIGVAEQRAQSAEASFKIMRRKFEEGVAAQVEYLDSQTTLTNAAINSVIARFDYYITYADFERIAAIYTFK